MADYDRVCLAIDLSGFEVTEVISGCARGADSLGERWAEDRGVPIIRFPAEWDKYGKSAGYRRNAEMAEVGEALIAIWDGKSRGTEMMINLARQKGLAVFVF
jgi:hypothetical protein